MQLKKYIFIFFLLLLSSLSYGATLKEANFNDGTIAPCAIGDGTYETIVDSTTSSFDPSATPRSLRFTFWEGWGSGGDAPYTVHCTHTKIDEVWTMFYVKYSSGWQLHPGGSKIVFMTDKDSTETSNNYMTGSPAGTFEWRVYVQVDSTYNREMFANVTWAEPVDGRWYRVTWRQTKSTQTPYLAGGCSPTDPDGYPCWRSNGIEQMWVKDMVTGIENQTHNYNDVVTTRPSDPNGYDRASIVPVWGGTGYNVPQTQYMYFDKFGVYTTDPRGDSGDTTPDQFTFTDITGASLNTQYTSNSITVSGINTASPISISGNSGQYSVNAGIWTSASGNVVNGDSVRVRQTSSASYSTAVNTTLNIGGVTDTYTVTTLPGGDTTPSQFIFTDVTGASLSTQYTSNSITVLEISPATPVAITIAGNSGQYEKNGSGTWTSAAGTVVLNDTVKVRQTTSASANTSVSTTLTISDVSDIYTVITSSAPTLLTPADNATNIGWPVSFTWGVVPNAYLYQLMVDNNSDFSSPEIDDATINPATACTVSVCTYNVNAGGALQSATHYYWRVRALR